VTEKENVRAKKRGKKEKKKILRSRPAIEREDNRQNRKKKSSGKERKKQGDYCEKEARDHLSPRKRQREQREAAFGRRERLFAAQKREDKKRLGVLWTVRGGRVGKEGSERGEDHACFLVRKGGNGLARTKKKKLLVQTLGQDTERKGMLRKGDRGAEREGCIGGEKGVRTQSLLGSKQENRGKRSERCPD